MKPLFILFLGLVFVFAFCTELRVEIQGNNTIHYQYEIDGVGTVFDLIDSCGIPYSLEYYPEFQTHYLKSFSGQTASELNGWQYFVNWNIGTTGISQTTVSDIDNVLFVYGKDFNHPEGIRPFRISSNVNCISQNENFVVNISYVSPTGVLSFSGDLFLHLLVDEENCDDYYVEAENGQIILQIDTPGIYEFFISSANNQYIQSNNLFVVVQGLTEIEDDIEVSKPVIQNYPNPFNKSTTIRYSLRSDEFVNVSIYNIKGQLVRRLVDEFQKSGKYKIVWDTKDNNNKQVCPGIYFFHMQYGKYTSSKKIILMK